MSTISHFSLLCFFYYYHLFTLRCLFYLACLCNELLLFKHLYFELIMFFFVNEVMDICHSIHDSTNNGDDMCLVDSATTHTILRSDKYFSNLSRMKANVNTISGTANLIEGSGRAIILMPRGTKIIIDDALLSTK